MPKSIRVILVDDHTLVRAGVRSLLDEIPDIDTVAEAEDGREALRAVRNSSPDIVLMDVAMPGLNGLDATLRITKEFPHVKVIMLSMYTNEEYVHQALRAGASGYLLKDSGTAELEVAIKAVASGKNYLSPTVSKQVVDNYLQRMKPGTNPIEDLQKPFDRLTPRQREVLQLIAEGHSTKEIAKILQLGIKTVDTHRSQLMDRLDIHEIAGLVRYAIRHGMVNPDK